MILFISIYSTEWTQPLNVATNWVTIAFSVTHRLPSHWTTNCSIRPRCYSTSEVPFTSWPCMNPRCFRYSHRHTYFTNIFVVAINVTNYHRNLLLLSLLLPLLWASSTGWKESPAARLQRLVACGLGRCPAVSTWTSSGSRPIST